MSFVCTLFESNITKDEAKVKNISNKLCQDDKVSLLMARWRFPSLTLHGIQGAYSGEGVKTIIPAKVQGKFSIRLVPHQEPDKIHRVVKEHLEREFAKVRSIAYRF